MIKGLIPLKGFEYLEFKSINVCHSTPWITSIQADCGTHFRNGGNDYFPGVAIVSRYTDADAWELNVNCPSLSGGAYHVFGRSDHDLNVRIYGKAYAYEYDWTVIPAKVELRDGGSLVKTWSTTKLDGEPFYKQLSAIPLFGMPIDCSVTPDVPVPRRTSDLGYVATYDWDSQWGWRLWIDGVAYEFPISIYNGTAPGGAFPAPDLPTLTGTTTWNPASTGAGYVDDSSGTDCTVMTNRVRLLPIPDLARNYHRLEDDYRALVDRYGLPAAIFTQTTTETSGGTVINPDPVTLIPQRAEFRAGITQPPHVYEDALNDPIYCVSTVEGTRQHLIASGVLLNDDYIRTDLLELHGAENAPIDAHPYLDSVEPVVRYWDYLCHPFQSHKMHFKDLNVQGSVLDAVVYETRARTQWISDPVLDPSEDTESRNHVVLDPVLSAEFFHETYVTHGARTLGLCRWTTFPITVRTGHAYDSASSALFTGTDCTLSFGADVTVVADPGKTSVILDLDLDSWTHLPFQWANLADRIRVDWTTTNISSIEWFLVGIDTTETPLNAIKGAYVSKPRGTATKYAFSFIDNGLGVCTDLGTDVTGAGISPATMADPERAKNFELTPGSTNQKLRARITLTTAGATCHVDYPELARQDGRKPYLVYENGKDCSLLYQDGAGIRFGNSDWYNGATYPPPTVPTTSGLGLQRSVVDFICDEREVLEGVDRVTNLLTQLTTLFDSEEASSFLNYKFDTYGIFLPNPTWTTVYAALGNLYAEVGPSLIFPRRERDFTTWEETGPWVHSVYSWCPGRKRYLAPGNVAVHVFDGATQKTIDDPVISSGWAVSSHETEVDNQETGWDLKQSGTHYGTATPWHGYMFVGTAVSEDGKNLHETVTRPGFLYQVLATKAEIHIRRFDLDEFDETQLVYTSSSQTLGIAQVGAFAATTLRIVFEEDGVVYYVESASFGTEGNWTMPTTIATGKNPAYAIDPRHNIEYVAVYDTGAGKWKMYRNKDGTGFVYLSDIATTATDDSAAGLELSPNELGTLVFVYDDGGTIKQTVSTNYGETWN